MAIDDWMLCSTCFKLVKSAKDHRDAFKENRNFTFPIDGDLNFVCSACKKAVNRISDVERHIELYPEHQGFEAMSNDEDANVLFSMKKREFAELEKTSSFKLNQGLLTPVKAPRPKEEELGSQELNQGLTPVKAFRKKAFDAFEVVQSLFSELRIGQGSNASKNSKVDGDSHPSTSDMKGLLQVLVARRSLEFLGLPKEDMDRLREAYVLVEDHINEESLGIISDHMKPCDPSNDYYEFKLTNVHCSRPEDYIFDTTLNQICLKKKIHCAVPTS